MTAALLKPVVTGFPVPFAPAKTTTKQICTYKVVLAPLGQDLSEEILRVSFDHVIDRAEIENWLESWFDLGYELSDVSPCEWQVQNPATGCYEIIWAKED